MVTDKKLLFQHERRVIREKGNCQYESADFFVRYRFKNARSLISTHWRCLVGLKKAHHHAPPIQQISPPGETSLFKELPAPACCAFATPPPPTGASFHDDLTNSSQLIPAFRHHSSAHFRQNG